jgi:transcriptional regulator with XRE-family HTH domain
MRERRVELDLSLRECAERMGVRCVEWSQVERGVRYGFSADQVETLAAILQTTPDRLTRLEHLAWEPVLTPEEVAADIPGEEGWFLGRWPHLSGDPADLISRMTPSDLRDPMAAFDRLHALLERLEAAP